MESEADHQDLKQRNQTALKSQETALLGSHSHQGQIDGIELYVRN